jgi:putative addiction module component (TIGR02574 family)
MDMASVLREVDSWPVEERIRFIQTVWDRMIDSGDEPELTDAQRAELDRRLAALDALPEDVIPWDAVQQHLSRPR